MKYNIKKLKVCLFLIVLFVFGSGCTGNQEQSAKENQDTHIAKVHTNHPVDQSVANQAKGKTIKREEVTGVKAVNTDKELLVALKVEQFDRFRLKTIKKNVKSNLEKTYPDYKVFVSTDQKIFLELEQLEQKLQKDQPKKKILNKEFDEIKSLMKEQA
ncbi:YhcN/YlaJ family sporulation lipoprotein [Priestia endophytica]|uniref:YhcN/YlaJ family sporulation lipoprotein n=1 Tax=Priestia endophytica TaxID=135735 RepID=UPI0022828BD2|nr:YhcN/YlaJ family sporulation lipoprotein [Priestia endophytica]MCY8234757.1 YhcN/YlaJ family sporulation lipoprotein [Priestia endophytica]